MRDGLYTKSKRIPIPIFDVNFKKKIITDILGFNQHGGRFSKIFEIIYRARILTQNIYLV